MHIEKGASVRDSIIGPNVSIAAGTRISGSIIRDSIINAETEVSDLILSNSIIGDSVTLHGTPRKMNIGDHSLIEME